MTFGMLAGVFGSMMSIMGASVKIIKIMETPPRINTEGGTKPTNIRGNAGINDVQFCYPTKPTAKVLRSVNFELPQGKVIALVGKSGCGKSSVIALL